MGLLPNTRFLEGCPLSPFVWLIWPDWTPVGECGYLAAFLLQRYAEFLFNRRWFKTPSVRYGMYSFFIYPFPFIQPLVSRLAFRMSALPPAAISENLLIGTSPSPPSVPHGLVLSSFPQSTTPLHSWPIPCLCPLWPLIRRLCRPLILQLLPPCSRPNQHRSHRPNLLTSKGACKKRMRPSVLLKKPAHTQVLNGSNTSRRVLQFKRRWTFVQPLTPRLHSPGLPHA